ncbi:MAG: hypothetical protein ABF317_08850, partial [Bacteroidia bacterium]
MRKYLTILAALSTLYNFGQLSTTISTKILPIQGDTLSFTDNFVLANSIKIDDYTLAKDYVQYDSKLVWLASTPSDSVILQYRSLDFRISYRNKNQEDIREMAEGNPFAYVPSIAESRSEYGELNTAGNVSRGIGFGNAQDVVVNSNLNLRLNGKLANDVEVLAVISDENNPIQPEGNTQQIQDFDQVYITLKKDSAVVTVGDFLMKRPQHSYFINYYKKSRGIQVKNVRSMKDWKLRTEAEAAISRGRFARNQIDGIEGNSGPYRLNGENGEQFIIVIAGTENVYLDGK